MDVSIATKIVIHIPPMNARQRQASKDMAGDNVYLMDDTWFQALLEDRGEGPHFISTISKTHSYFDHQNVN